MTDVKPIPGKITDGSLQNLGENSLRVTFGHETCKRGLVRVIFDRTAPPDATITRKETKLTKDLSPTWVTGNHFEVLHESDK